MIALQKNLEDLEVLLSSLEVPMNILCLTEIWLKESDNNNEIYKISEFHSTLANNRLTRGGGTIMNFNMLIP